MSLAKVFSFLSAKHERKKLTKREVGEYALDSGINKAISDLGFSRTYVCNCKSFARMERLKERRWQDGDRSVECAPLSTRARFALMQVGVKDIGRTKSLSRTKLLSVHGIGLRTCSEIAGFCDEYGIKLTK